MVVVLLGACRSAPPPIQAPEPLPAPLPPVVVSTPAPTPSTRPLPRATPVPTAAPGPAALPAPTPGPPAPPWRPGEIPVRPDVQPPLIRVLLSTPSTPVFPQPGRRYVTVNGGDVRVIRGPLTATAVAGGSTGFQVGAFREDANAAEAAARLSAARIQSIVRTDSSGLKRVIALPEPGEGADALHARLQTANFRRVIRVAGVGEELALVGEDGFEVRGGRLELIPVDDVPVEVGGKSVHGQFELRPAADGVTVINEVSLEEYLRGVVPAEMGPRAFPALEALKAQAVAARTYAVAHLGEHAADGYDVCDTQSCQVYGGADAEQPLTDRAVAETRGLVATYQGKPIDAMYHSTCGGHTEDAAQVFPERAAPYLLGVACRTGDELTVGSAGEAGAWLDRTASLALVGDLIASRLGVPDTAAAVAERLGGRPAVGGGTAGLVAAFGVDDTSLLLHGRAKGDGEWILRLLDIFHTDLPPLRPGGDRARWEMALVTRLSELTGAVREVKGRVLGGATGVQFTNDDGDVAFAVDAEVTVEERRDGRWRVAQVGTLPGAPATAWLMGGTPIVVEVEPRSEADAGSAWSWWARDVAAGEVAKAGGLADAQQVEVTERGISGRATTVEVTGGGTTRSMRGVLFRYAVGLPDTLFVVQERDTASGKVFRFIGRGWGHGVGMCQNGAYGMARGGATFDQILKTYYTGVEITPWTGASQAGGTP
jgi:stage II sporulation protein D